MTDGTRRLLARVALIAAPMVVVAVLAPEIITGTFSDVGTFLRVALLAAGVGAWVWLVGRVMRDRPGRALLAYGPVAVLLALLLWPYVRPATEVDEAFPVTAGPDTTQVAPSTLPVTTTTSPATIAPSATAVPRSSSGPSSTTTTPTTSTTSTTTSTTTTQPPEPVLLGSGTFQGLTGHRGSGTASIYDLPDGSRLLRFDEVDIGSGPKLIVYLVPGADQRGLGGGVEIAPLTAERGNQNYTLDPAMALAGTWTVLVWGETFAVEVANATLEL